MLLQRAPCNLRSTTYNRETPCSKQLIRTNSPAPLGTKAVLVQRPPPARASTRCGALHLSFKPNVLRRLKRLNPTPINRHCALSYTYRRGSLNPGFHFIFVPSFFFNALTALQLDKLTAIHLDNLAVQRFDESTALQFWCPNSSRSPPLDLGALHLVLTSFSPHQNAVTVLHAPWIRLQSRAGSARSARRTFPGFHFISVPSTFCSSSPKTYDFFSTLFSK